MLAWAEGETSQAASEAKRRSFRQVLQTIHLWAGLILFVPIVLVGLSGSALLLQREILRLSVPSASAAGEAHAPSRIIAAAQSVRPGDSGASWIEFPASRGRPAAVHFIAPDQPMRRIEVYVDPVSLEVLGTSPVIRRGPINRTLVTLHAFLLMPVPIGMPFVGWIAVTMTFMGLSGLYLWWPKKGRWLSAFMVRRGARGLRLHLDLHHAAGIWGLVAFLILSVSGIYLAFPQTFSSAVRSAFSPRAQDIQRPIDGSAMDWPMSVDDVFAFAPSTVPGTRINGIQLPDATASSFVVQLERTGLQPSFPPIWVTFDAENKRIHVDDPKRYSTAERVLNQLYALHFSVGFGWLWNAVVFLSGLVPLVLGVTGIYIWLLKRRARIALAGSNASAGRGSDIPASAPQAEPA